MKHLALDSYAGRDSAIHRWESRSKFVGLMALIVAFAAIRDVRMLPVMLGAAAGLYVLSQLPRAFLISRLKLPGVFILFLVVVLPFISGTDVLYELGPLSLRQEGLSAAVLIVSRFVSIITVTLVLLATAPILTSIGTLRAFGLPSVLADMVLLTYRYLFELSEMLHTMRTAIRLRGYDGTRLSVADLTILASLIGSLLVRSHDRSERVYNAMVLRGYGPESPKTATLPPRRTDIVLSCLAVALAATIVGVQLWLRWQGGA